MRPPGAARKSRIGAEVSRGQRSTASLYRRARPARHRSGTCMRSGAADHGGGGAPNTARVSARGTDPALRWERGWERGGSKSGPSVAVDVRLCPFGNLAFCREFPMRTGNAGPLGPPSTEPKVRGSNPLGRISGQPRHCGAPRGCRGPAGRAPTGAPCQSLGCAATCASRLALVVVVPGGGRCAGSTAAMLVPAGPGASIEPGQIGRQGSRSSRTRSTNTRALTAASVNVSA
jgi:hypothetical protein